MRKVIDLQMEFWRKDIANIEFDLQSRDEIPKLLMGLQHIYSTSFIREKVFEILKQIVPKKSQETGRPGMDLWKILVLGTLRLNCNCDYDKVLEMANNHSQLREMLGHSKTDFDSQYALQTIRDNIVLLTPAILDEINQIVVKAGHSLISPNQDPPLRGSCDSFVVETDVHYPTDTNLLFDAMRKMISLIAIICSEVGVTAWRQSHHNIIKVKRLLRGIQRLRRSTSIVFGFLIFGIDLADQVAGFVIVIGSLLALGPDFFHQPVVAVVFEPGDVVLRIRQCRQVVAVVIGVIGALGTGQANYK
jgi:hypothetical protein